MDHRGERCWRAPPPSRADLEPRLVALDLNPVVVGPDGTGVTVVDASSSWRTRATLVREEYRLALPHGCRPEFSAGRY